MFKTMKYISITKYAVSDNWNIMLSKVDLYFEVLRERDARIVQGCLKVCNAKLFFVWKLNLQHYRNIVT